jgi:hypothetical protein
LFSDIQIIAAPSEAIFHCALKNIVVELPEEFGVALGLTNNERFIQANTYSNLPRDFLSEPTFRFNLGMAINAL